MLILILFTFLYSFHYQQYCTPSIGTPGFSEVHRIESGNQAEL